MGQGLQVWNSSGVLIFDTPDSISRVLGSQVVTAGSSGSITLPTGYGSYWWHISPTDGGRYFCVVSVSGNTLSYSPNTQFTPAVDCLLIYGAY